jgi:hypothetical protein
MFGVYNSEGNCFVSQLGSVGADPHLFDTREEAEELMNRLDNTDQVDIVKVELNQVT